VTPTAGPHVNPIPDFLPALVESTLDVLIVLEIDGTFRYASPSLQRVVGWQPAEVIGTNAFAYIHADDQAMVMGVLQRMLGNPGIESQAEYRFRHQDGSWRWVQSLGTSRMDDPRVRGVVVSARDITDSQRLSEQLQQTQRLEAIGRLAGGIAHDFNNILTNILGCAESIIERDPDGDMGGAARQISSSAERAAELTRQLLVFARRQAAHPVIIDVGVALANQDAFLRRVLSPCHVLAYDIQPGTRVRIDPNQFDQVVMNLVLNARDALSDGGLITISTQVRQMEVGDPIFAYLPAGSYVAIAVTDAGSGMPPAVLAQACDPFFTTKETGKGTGLGLSVVHGIVCAANGRLHLISTLGRGTVATVVLPFAAGEPARPAPRERTPLPSGGGTLLLVEDDPGIRQLTETLLVRAGYEVITAADGRDGLLRFQAHPAPIDLLITDVIMPHLDGPSLVVEARKIQPGLPVLYMSGYHEVAMDPGAEVLDKPFTAARLLARVRSILGQRTP